MEYNRVEFDRLREDFSRNTDSEQVDLAYIKREDAEGRINTEMDIQRQYVWNAAREQQMWDTLLLNVRIPEFHAILSGRVRNICDGKQRLTCILRILRNEVPYYAREARPECKWLFDYAAKVNKRGVKIVPRAIYFSDLPQELQDTIESKTITIIRYSGLDRKEEISLFKKINYGIALSDFARGMASCYYMRKDFTGPLMATKELDNIMIQDNINDEELETILVRALLLCSNDDPINLQPNVLENYYAAYEDMNIINSWQSKFYQLLKRFPNLNLAFKCRSRRAIVPFVLEGVYRHPELTSDQIGQLCEAIIDYSSGRGQDLGSRRVIENRNYINNLINIIQTSKVA